RIPHFRRQDAGPSGAGLRLRNTDFGPGRRAPCLAIPAHTGEAGHRGVHSRARRRPDPVAQATLRLRGADRLQRFQQLTFPRRRTAGTLGVGVCQRRRRFQSGRRGRSRNRRGHRGNAERPRQGRLCCSGARSGSTADLGSLYGAHAACPRAVDSLLGLSRSSGQDAAVRVPVASLVAQGAVTAPERTAMYRIPLIIDVVSDVVCPWCYLGAKRLEAAAAGIDGVEVRARRRPFQVAPAIPPDGAGRRGCMRNRSGGGRRCRAVHGRLVSPGAAEGSSCGFGAIKVSPNSLDAHRVIRWAGTYGEEVQTRLVGEMFSRYFERGENTGDRHVLAEAAGAAGMDVPVVETLLATDADADAVRAEIATASRMGITGVPCFLLEGRYAVMGAQESAVLADAIRQVASAKARGELDEPED